MTKKTNAYAFLDGYMNKTAGMADIGKKAVRNYGGLAAKGGAAAGGVIGGKHIINKVKKATDNIGNKRKKAVDDALGDRPKETPAVQNNKKE